MAFLDDFLTRLGQGGLDMGEMRAQLHAHATRVPAELPDITQRIRAEVAAGRLSPAQGDTLIDVVQEAERTLVQQGQLPAGDHTVLRAGVQQPDALPDDGTSLRPRSAVQHSTLVSDPASNTAAPTQQFTAAGGAYAQTLQAGDVTVGRSVQADAAHADTLQATQVIQDRLVRELPNDDGPLEPGRVIKQRFVLETLLGRGGMGLVFGAIDRRKEEARDPNPRVALKVLNADFKRHPQSFIALQREARKAQSLAHPNVVTVFDFDRDGEVVYMTMELLKGRPLDAIVRAARGKGNDPQIALPIILGIAEGLAYAHRKGIVHSDLKPGNVFITEDDTAKILDFGIARAVPSSASDDQRDEFDAGTLGAYTEAYATDEMVSGTDPHPADDMYALGIIAYELLSGFHPYQRHSAPNARKFGIKPAPLKGIKRHQARAIEACLSFDRRQRPQDAAEFLKAFRGVSLLQKASLAVAVVLAVVAGYLWYQNHLETSPAIAFEQLPAQAQQEFREYMQEGDTAWRFYQTERLPDAAFTALEFYSRAYEEHPRNREAVAGLNKAADALLKEAAHDKALQQDVARRLQEHSPHLRRYAPVVKAAQQ